MTGENSAKAAAGEAGMAKPSFRERFLAWWEGYELSRAERKAEKNGRKPADRGPVETTVKSWPEPRREIVQLLFGPGMISPDDPASIMRMIQPLGLNEKHTVVEIGAGLGGLARLVAKETKAYVFGFEADQDLVREGNDLSAKAGLTKKAQLKCMPPGEFEARPKSVDAIVAKESLLSVPNKSEVFAAMRKALKAGGQLTITDFMLATDSVSPAVEQWLDSEPVRPDLKTAADTRAELESLGLEVRVLEDISDEFSASTRAAFATMAHQLRLDAAEHGEVNEDRQNWVLSEGGLWLRRLAALASGEVRLYRIYARLAGVKELT